MTEKEYVDRINRCDREVENGEAEGFSYLHYLECDKVDTLNRLEQGLLKVISDLERQNGLDLGTEKQDLKRVLDNYYEVLTDAQKKYRQKLDHILWERVLPLVGKSL